jgi:hypothetical protein
MARYEIFSPEFSLVTRPCQRSRGYTIIYISGVGGLTFLLLIVPRDYIAQVWLGWIRD